MYILADIYIYSLRTITAPYDDGMDVSESERCTGIDFTFVLCSPNVHQQRSRRMLARQRLKWQEAAGCVASPRIKSSFLIRREGV